MTELVAVVRLPLDLEGEGDGRGGVHLRDELVFAREPKPIGQVRVQHGARLGERHGHLGPCNERAWGRAGGQRGREEVQKDLRDGSACERNESDFYKNAC